MPRQNSPQPEVPANPVPAWMVTFSDCMTLLLCFFVLLLTFSSFDEVSLDKLGGAFPGMSYSSVFPNKRTVLDSIVPPKPTEVDYTEQGSEVPTDSSPLIDIENPKKLNAPLDADTYRNRKTIRIPSDRLFIARGSVLSGRGKTLAAKIAAFIRKMPCKMIVTETNTAANRTSPARALALVRYFTEVEGLAVDYFGVSASPSQSPGRANGRPVIEITMLKGNLYR